MSARCCWTCDEIGIAYAREDWGTGFRSTKEAEFQALNPKSLVPVVLDGDIVLTESSAICRYLAAKHGRTDLLPLDPAARAGVELWMDWQIADLNGAWRYAVQAILREPASQSGPRANRRHPWPNGIRRCSCWRATSSRGRGGCAARCSRSPIS